MATPLSDPTTADDVVAEWIDPHLPTVFSRWHDAIAALQRASIDAVIAAARVTTGDRVLDVGCGSGIPSLALAKRVGPEGQVIATDPSAVFVAAVRDNARRLGLANLDALQASAAALPFPPESFNAATSHMSVMFFPNVAAGLARIRETLKPGGCAAFVAWGPAAENELFGTFWGAARPYLPPDATAEPPPDVPAPMRFAEPGTLSDALRGAGFMDVLEETRTVELVWPGRTETLCDFWFELTRLDDKLSPGSRDACRADVRDAYRRFDRDDALHLDAAVVVASGQA